MAYEVQGQISLKRPCCGFINEIMWQRTNTIQALDCFRTSVKIETFIRATFRFQIQRKNLWQAPAKDLFYRTVRKFVKPELFGFVFVLDVEKIVWTTTFTRTMVFDEVFANMPGIAIFLSSWTWFSVKITLTYFGLQLNSYTFEVASQQIVHRVDYSANFCTRGWISST